MRTRWALPILGMMLVAGALWPGGGRWATRLWGAANLQIDAVTASTRLADHPTEIRSISTYEALTFDPAKQGEAPFSYVLSRPAWIRIRIVHRGDEELLLRTLEDWSQRDEGRNAGTWDGRDGDGNLLDGSQCRVVFTAADRSQHAGHAWQECADLPVRIGTKASPAGVRVTTTLADSSPSRGGEYEVRFYVDAKLQARQRHAAAAPLEWTWEAVSAAAGSHRLTVVVDDGRDHLGTASTIIELPGPQ